MTINNNVVVSFGLYIKPILDRDSASMLPLPKQSATPRYMTMTMMSTLPLVVGSM